jgi:hypothetical protein
VCCRCITVIDTGHINMLKEVRMSRKQNSRLVVRAHQKGREVWMMTNY